MICVFKRLLKQKNIHQIEIRRLECPLCPDSNSVYNESELKKHYQTEHPEVEIETKLTVFD